MKQLGGFSIPGETPAPDLPTGGRVPPLPKRRQHHTATYACIDCGTVVTRKRTPDEPRVCLDCGIDRAAEAARQMHAKAGPLYDAFRRNRWPGRDSRSD